MIIRRNLLKGMALCSVLRFSPALLAQSFALAEQPAPGQRFRIQAKSDLTGSMISRPENPKDPVQKIQLQGESHFDFDETILAMNSSHRVERTLRDYRKASMSRVLNQARQETALRSGLKSLVLVHKNSREIAFSPEEPLLWGEVDLLQTEVFPCALSGLLPGKETMVLSTWQPDTTSLLELTDLESIQGQNMQCKLESKGLINNRSLARVSFAGKVSGMHEDGPNQQILDGSLFFDVETRHISYIHLKGASIFLGVNGEEVGRMEGKFQLHREILPRTTISPELLATTTPTPANTRFLFEQAGTPFSFTYPRAWRVATGSDRQVVLEHPEGASILLARLDPALIPDTQAYQKQAREYFEKEKALLENETAIAPIMNHSDWSGFSWQVRQSQKLEQIHYFFRSKPFPVSLAVRYSGERRDFREDALGIALALKTTK